MFASRLDDPAVLLYLLVGYPIFLFSLTIHEVAHALTAKWGGDMTAAWQDRITLNPVAHIDLVGTVLIPISRAFSTIPLIGWAKPVPVNTMAFRDPAWDVVVSVAGPFSNLLLAIGGALLQNLVYAGVDLAGGLPESMHRFGAMLDFFFSRFLEVNLALAVFNMIPIPPLDGSHVFHHFFIRGRGHLYAAWDFYGRFGGWILWGLLLTGVLGMYTQPMMKVAMRALFALVRIPDWIAHG